LEKYPDTHESETTTEEVQKNGKARNSLLAEASKNKNSKFESDYLNLAESLTEQCMEDFRPYLQQDFNMARLSVLVNIPVHHLAYYFREVKKTSFTDFRNRWRVEYAKKLILEGKSNDLTLEAIGMLSGFSSRNTFLNAFKKAEGISPSAYLSRVNIK
jgi:AraC-like DNA-binding protein